MIRRISVLLVCSFYLASCASFPVQQPKPVPEVVVAEPVEPAPRPRVEPTPPPIPEQNPVVGSSGGGSDGPKIITCAVC